MAKQRTLFVCEQCGGESPKWLGRCPECGAWNTLVETSRSIASARAAAGGAPDARGRQMGAAPERLPAISLTEVERLPTGIGEFDRVLGGGIVPGSLVLIGGDPGIGKSTLLLQVASQLAAGAGAGRRVLYVSGEESSRQIRLRAERLGTLPAELFVLAETNVDAVLERIEQLQPDLVVVDSIQTAFLTDVAASPGNVSQLRECTLRFMNVAKSRHLPIFLVGHVTKEGTIAGPRVLEHIVDCVLYLEGERFSTYRLLRAVKNRFGSTNEIGVFDMQADGMSEVVNPSAAFLSERSAASAGSAVTIPLEGSRALLVEVQALVSSTPCGLPKRTAIGVDAGRLSLLVAVLGKHVGLPLSSHDVYVNVVSGLKLAEPAVDLGVALAIASSVRDVPVDPKLALVGEIGLLGELRPAGQCERRLAEASRLGFERCLLPAGDLRRLSGDPAARQMRHDGLTLLGVRSVDEAVTLTLGAASSGSADGSAGGTLVDRRAAHAGGARPTPAAVLAADE